MSVPVIIVIAIIIGVAWLAYEIRRAPLVP